MPLTNVRGGRRQNAGRKSKFGERGMQFQAWLPPSAIRAIDELCELEEIDRATLLVRTFAPQLELKKEAEE